MSIEKLSDSSKIYVERNPYTQILNNVIEHIKDNDAYRLYSYLSSKSRDWKVAKKWTAKHCGVGETKAKRCWSYLERCGLIEYIISKDEKGKITSYDVRVLNGLKFKQDEPFLKPKESSGLETNPQETQWANLPPTGKSTPLDFCPQLNKDINKNKDLKNKRDFSSNDKKINTQQTSGFSSVDKQSNSYNPDAPPRGEQPSELLTKWQLKKQGNKT